MTEGGNGAISACVFDAYGTLFDVNSAARRCTDRLGENAGRLAEIWRAKQLEYAWVHALSERYIDFWQVTSKSLDYAMAAIGVEDSALRARLMQLYLSLEPYPEAAECLEALRAARVRTAILSNGEPSMLISAAKNARLAPLLDSILSVDPERTYKPAPVVYKLASDALKLAPEQILYVSANGWDVYGAGLHGYRAVWVCRDARPADMLHGAADLVIRSLAEVPALITS